MEENHENHQGSQSLTVIPTWYLDSHTLSLCNPALYWYPQCTEMRNLGRPVHTNFISIGSV